MGSSLITGIDIGSHSIKAVVLKPVGELYALVGYKELAISDDIFTDNHTLEYQKIVKKLKELRKTLPLFSRKVAMSVPDNAVISKVLQIDSDLEHREKEFAIYQTFAHQSPFPIEELILDFVEIEEKRVGKTATTSYQVYATRKEVVDSRIEASKKAGFQPVVVDIQAHSLLNIWQLASRMNPDKQRWLLIDVGVNHTSLGIIPFGRSPFYKDMAYGTKYLKQDSDGGLPDILGTGPETQLFINELIDRLKRQLQLYTSVNASEPIAGVWLMGDGANTPMLAEEIERQLKLDCELLNPLSLFENKLAKKRRYNVDWQAFGLAAGLAICGLQWEATKHVASN
ncbi:type IV pilus assembly protein PilM [Vibrio sp. T187]|uniref:type IV pilus assembly protein PilM n=1 Tax=Vibrio TaxID=662 RepID=UPI0010C943AF|nr:MULTISPECIES: type IV pilus assembly protein PilM [Vibrio]MBW3697348.1 type IV pilus assembly protein PilM [Vibrio sp. T187]